MNEAYPKDEVRGPHIVSTFLLAKAMSRLLIGVLLSTTTVASAHSQFVTAREYSAAAARSDGRAPPSVWSIEGEGGVDASLPERRPSGFELCSGAVTTVGNPVYIFGHAQFRLVGDAPGSFVTSLTSDGHFIRTEPLTAALGATTLITLSALDRPPPGLHVYSVVTAKFPEVPAGGWRCNVTIHEYIE